VQPRKTTRISAAKAFMNLAVGPLQLSNKRSTTMTEPYQTGRRNDAANPRPSPAALARAIPTENLLTSNVETLIEQTLAGVSEASGSTRGKTAQHLARKEAHLGAEHSQ
jgi:hypothetical protein